MINIGLSYIEDGYFKVSQFKNIYTYKIIIKTICTLFYLEYIILISTFIIFFFYSVQKWPNMPNIKSYVTSFQ